MVAKEDFIQTVQIHMDMVFRLAFSSIGSYADAEDIAQTVFLRLYQTEKIFENDTHLKHWLLRVTINECKKHWRSPWRRIENWEDHIPALIDESPQNRDLLQAIMTLDEKYRTVIVLYYVEGYTVGEIAKLLSIPLGTVGTRLSRAKNKLKQYLTEDNENNTPEV